MQSAKLFIKMDLRGLLLSFCNLSSEHSNTRSLDCHLASSLKTGQNLMTLHDIIMYAGIGLTLMMRLYQIS